MRRLLATTFLAALTMETVGALDPFGGQVYLPPPARYVATFIVWFVLGLVGETGPRAARAAGTFSLLVLGAMVLSGPFGRKSLTFLEGVSSRFPAATA